MLLEVNRSSLHSKTPKGESPLCLAKKTAKEKHPNLALISELEAQLEASNGEDIDNESQLAETSSVVGHGAPGSASRVAIQQPAPVSGQSDDAEE
jgi:hypothetical protein